MPGRNIRSQIVKTHISNYLFAISFLFACTIFDAASAQTPPPPLKPQPFYEQCQSLAAGKSGDDAVAQAIAALKGKEAKTRIQAAQQLGKSCDSRAVEPLLDLLKDEDPLVRIAATQALGKLGDTESVEPMVELVIDKDWRVRFALISTMASFKTFRARNTVLNGIANPSGVDVTDENDMRVRCAAILTVNQLKDVQYSRKAILFLYSFLESKHEHIRKLAEQTLFELKNTRNFPSEMNALLKQHANFEMRRWAAYWMGRLGLESGREALENAAANDPDARVKLAASEALKQLPVVK
jgi:HEAT repeat protein